MKNRNAFVLGMIVLPLALLGLGVAIGSNVVTPNVFTAGTTAVASQVNDNFSAHATAINDNDARLNAAQAQIDLLNCAFLPRTDSQFFAPNGGVPETFTVPAGVTCLKIHARAPRGGTAGSTQGGNGDALTAVVAVTPGEDLVILVGTPGEPTGFSSAAAGGGGGGTFVAKGTTTAAFAAPLVVAGGGGGSSDSGGGTRGGTGGILLGGTGLGGGAASEGGGGGGITGDGADGSLGSGGQAAVAGGTGGAGYASNPGGSGGGGGGGDRQVGGGGGGGYTGGDAGTAGTQAKGGTSFIAPGILLLFRGEAQDGVAGVFIEWTP